MTSQTQSDKSVQEAIQQMEVAANNVATRLAQSASVRARYLVEIREMSASLWDAYRAGEISASQAAAVANESRNEILKMARARDMDFGRAYAQSLKKAGLELDKVILYIMNQKAGFKERFAGKLFKDLTAAQQTEVYEEVIKSAGRDRGSVTKGLPRLRWAARGLWVATAAIAIYNVGTSETPWWQTGREASTIGGGLLGSIGAGAAMGAAGGVWAGPIGVGVGVIVGGVLGALLADHAFVEATGTADPLVRTFVARYTSFWTGVDETGLAQALLRESPARLDFVVRVFRALDSDYHTDVDDVAYEYAKLAMVRPPLAAAIKAHAPLRAALIGAMSSGYTSGDEARMVAWLRAG